MSLPAIPETFKGEFKEVSHFSAPLKVAVEPVGQYFLAHATRTLQNRTWSEYEQIKQKKEEAEKANETKDENADIEDVTDDELLEHDPRDWKTCDMYGVLGLTKFRYRATKNQIDRAYRKQVLTFHPDKQGEKKGFQDGFFKIIQKAYETLSDPSKRREFDSVDKHADVAVPAKGTKYDFFESFGPVFEAEGRFSTKQPVPGLGDAKATKEQVEDFYKFWNNFDSWRTFEWLDEDVPDDTSNRDHKRYIEKKNNNARRRRKTKDNIRLADLVQRVHSEDPRIKQFKKAEKEAKAQRKWEREAGARKEAAEAKAKAEAEAKAKADAEAKAEKDRAQHKKSKQAKKSAKKKAKRAVRAAVAESKHFGDESKATSIDADVEALLSSLEFDALTELGDQVKDEKDAAKLKQALEAAAKTTSAVYEYFNKQ